MINIKRRKFKLNELDIKGLQLIADGYSSKQIGDMLSRSYKYIRGSFRSSICNVLGATNTYNAVAVAIRKGIIK